MGRMTAPLPFIGRDRELGEIGLLLARARAGRGLAVAVTGEPGIGKTRFCEEALATARPAGFLACSTVGNPTLSTVPMALASGLLRSALEQLPAAEQASITSGLPGLGSIMSLQYRHDGGGFGEAAVIDAVAEFCKRLCARRPVVAHIDGFECADAASMRLAVTVAGRLAHRPFVLLVSTRRGMEPQRLALADLARLGRIVHLERLTQQSSEALVKLVRPDLGASDRRALAKDSEGLPVYLAGVLAAAAGASGTREPPEVMRVQLEALWLGLSEPARAMSRLLAVAGGAVAERILLRLWPEAGTFGAALRELVDAELAVPGTAGIRFSHPSYGRILAGGMFHYERKEHHRRFAAALGADAQPDSLPSLADHLLEIADETDPETLRAALMKAADAPGIPDERLCLYLEHGLAMLPPDAEAQTRYQLFSRLGAAQQRLGRPDLARTSWNHALDDAPGAGLTAAHHFGAAQTQLAFQEWETGAAAEDDSKRYDPYRGALHRLIWTTRYGTWEENLEAARTAIELGEGSPAGAPFARLGYCFTAWAQGRYKDALQHALEASRMAQGEDVRSMATIALSRVAPLAGGLEDSLEAVRALADSTAAAGSPYAECATRSWAALAHHVAGNLAAAEEQLRPAVQLAAESGAAPVIARISLVMGLLEAERGNFTAATGWLADAQRIRGDAAWQADLEGLQSLVRGLIALGNGRPDRVPREVPLAAGNYPVLALMLPFNSGLAGIQTGDRDRTRDCLAMLAVDPSQGRPVHALGVRLRGVDLVSGGKPGEGAQYLQEAADVLDSCGFRLYGSQARVEWAEAVEPKDAARGAVPALLRYFEGQKVGWWLQRTRRLARLTGYVEDHPHRNGHTLSRREAEVVIKASAGLSNSTIAEQLFLSERTIESHLRNVYKRLGLPSRVSLAAWAAAHPEEFSTATDTAADRPGPSSVS